MPTTYFTPGVYVEEVSSGLAPIAGVGTSTAGFIGVIPPSAQADADADTLPIASGQVELCTNFTEFKTSFGDFSAKPGQNMLAHSVYGFFRNGGTRCFVVWVADEADIPNALEKFEAIDEIAIVAAPGVTSKAALSTIIDHCQSQGDRFAIIDTEEDIAQDQLKPGSTKLPGNSDYAALYYPWIQVFDPITKGMIFVPPSGHIAGIYARVDDRRGVHKAPANEPILGAVGLKQDISKAKQAPLNNDGINCLRNLNGNIRVWGARTLGAGKDNPDFKYINIRRQFNYLRESIDEGTQWVVFEPNDAELWAKIRRNITAFLMNEWRKGALFGTTPQEAFYVKCDAENNPIESRKLGQVVAEVGVAVIEPAEFVIFRINQLLPEEK
ncbi:MAG: phage tail sheath subtilisin-like domain-containing protein [Synechococcales bacterium]|nr:phage tail sheath subtilisin-like domain-containing protein [Synechococcales bacterium]